MGSIYKFLKLLSSEKEFVLVWKFWSCKEKKTQWTTVRKDINYHSRNQEVGDSKLGAAA